MIAHYSTFESEERELGFLPLVPIATAVLPKIFKMFGKKKKKKAAAPAPPAADEAAAGGSRSGGTPSWVWGALAGLGGVVLLGGTYLITRRR